MRKINDREIQSISEQNAGRKLDFTDVYMADDLSDYLEIQEFNDRFPLEWHRIWSDFVGSLLGEADAAQGDYQVSGEQGQKHRGLGMDIAHLGHSAPWDQSPMSREPIMIEDAEINFLRQFPPKAWGSVLASTLWGVNHTNMRYLGPGLAGALRNRKEMRAQNPEATLNNWAEEVRFIRPGNAGGEPVFDPITLERAPSNLGALTKRPVQKAPNPTPNPNWRNLGAGHKPGTGVYVPFQHFAEKIETEMGQRRKSSPMKVGQVGMPGGLDPVQGGDYLQWGSKSMLPRDRTGKVTANYGEVLPFATRSYAPYTGAWANMVNPSSKKNPAQDMVRDLAKANMESPEMFNQRRANVLTRKFGNPDPQADPGTGKVVPTQVRPVRGNAKPDNYVPYKVNNQTGHLIQKGGRPIVTDPNTGNKAQADAIRNQWTPQELKDRRIKGIISAIRKNQAEGKPINAWLKILKKARNEYRRRVTGDLKPQDYEAMPQQGAGWHDPSQQVENPDKPGEKMSRPITSAVIRQQLPHLYKLRPAKGQVVKVSPGMAARYQELMTRGGAYAHRKTFDELKLSLRPECRGDELFLKHWYKARLVINPQTLTIHSTGTLAGNEAQEKQMVQKGEVTPLDQGTYQDDWLASQQDEHTVREAEEAAAPARKKREQNPPWVWAMLDQPWDPKDTHPPMGQVLFVYEPDATVYNIPILSPGVLDSRLRHLLFNKYDKDGNLDTSDYIGQMSNNPEVLGGKITALRNTEEAFPPESGDEHDAALFGTDEEGNPKTFAQDFDTPRGDWEGFSVPIQRSMRFGFNLGIKRLAQRQLIGDEQREELWANRSTLLQSAMFYIEKNLNNPKAWNFSTNQGINLQYTARTFKPLYAAIMGLDKLVEKYQDRIRTYDYEGQPWPTYGNPAARQGAAPVPGNPQDRTSQTVANARTRPQGQGKLIPFSQLPMNFIEPALNMLADLRDDAFGGNPFFQVKIPENYVRSNIEADNNLNKYIAGGEADEDRPGYPATHMKTGQRIPQRTVKYIDKKTGEEREKELYPAMYGNAYLNITPECVWHLIEHARYLYWAFATSDMVSKIWQRAYRTGDQDMADLLRGGGEGEETGHGGGEDESDDNIFDIGAQRTGQEGRKGKLPKGRKGLDRLAMQGDFDAFMKDPGLWNRIRESGKPPMQALRDEIRQATAAARDGLQRAEIAAESNPQDVDAAVERGARAIHLNNFRRLAGAVAQGDDTTAQTFADPNHRREVFNQTIAGSARQAQSGNIEIPSSRTRKMTAEQFLHYLGSQLKNIHHPDHIKLAQRVMTGDPAELDNLLKVLIQQGKESEGDDYAQFTKGIEYHLLRLLLEHFHQTNNLEDIRAMLEALRKRRMLDYVQDGLRALIDQYEEPEQEPAEPTPAPEPETPVKGGFGLGRRVRKAAGE